MYSTCIDRRRSESLILEAMIWDGNIIATVALLNGNEGNFFASRKTHLPILDGCSDPLMVAFASSLDPGSLNMPIDSMLIVLLLLLSFPCIVYYKYYLFLETVCGVILDL